MPGAEPARLDLVAVIKTYQSALVASETTINRLNVFPVPDGDTGTNMRSTIDAVRSRLETTRATGPELARAIAESSLLGARGNSGIILAQYLRALTEEVPDLSAIGAATFPAALRVAAVGARSSVGIPTEGTILSVADGAASRAAVAFAGGDDLCGVVSAAYEGARDALFATPSQLLVLERDGVVDAGGAGLLLLFAAMAHEFQATSSPCELELPSHVLGTLATSREDWPIDNSDRIAGGDRSYEVVLLLDTDEDAIASLQAVWLSIGDSVVIVGGAPTWKCHIHTEDIACALELAIERGRPHEIRITDLDRQVAEEVWVSNATREAPEEIPAPLAEAVLAMTGVVVVCDGMGLARVLYSLGAAVVIEGGPAMNPSTAELLSGTVRVSASEVVVLPNNPNEFAIANEVVHLSGRTVEVVESTDIASAISAMVHFDPGADAKTNANKMRRALDQVVTGEITRAIRDAMTEVGAVVPGDHLAISRSQIVAACPSLIEATTAFVSSVVLDTHEIVTLYRGVGPTKDEVELVAKALRSTHPDLSVEVVDGGQHHAELLVAIE